MRRSTVLILTAALAAAGPALPQQLAATPEAELIPVPPEQHGGSPGSLLGSAAVGGSGILVLVGLVTVVTLGVIAAAAND